VHVLEVAVLIIVFVTLRPPSREIEIGHGVTIEERCLSRVHRLRVAEDL
jgi:hypothetical protein